MSTSFQKFISFCCTASLSVAALTFITLSASAQQVAPRVPFAKPQAVPPRAVPPARRAPPKVTIKAKHGAWVVRCEKVRVRVPVKAKPAGKKGSKGNRGDRTAAKTPATRIVDRCALVQALKPPKGRKVSMQIMLQKIPGPKGKQALLMRMIVPLGVYLSDGIGLQVDGKAVGRFPYTRCYPQACTATIPVRPSLLKQLKKGKKANFFVYAYPGQGINMPLLLNGFTKALKAL